MNNSPLLHNNVYIDENMDIFIHEYSISLFIEYTYPKSDKENEEIHKVIHNIFQNESRYVTISGEKYYHEKFVKKILNLKK